MNRKKVSSKSANVRVRALEIQVTGFHFANAVNFVCVVGLPTANDPEVKEIMRKNIIPDHVSNTLQLTKSCLNFNITSFKTYSSFFYRYLYILGILSNICILYNRGSQTIRGAEPFPNLRFCAEL